MSIKFNTILGQFDVDPKTVCLLRHQDKRATRRRTPYRLWHDDREAFERYQSTQSVGNRPKLSRRGFWASFIASPVGDTLFAGLYAAQYLGLTDRDMPWPHAEGFDPAGSCDRYDLKLDIRFMDLMGRLVVEWGDGKLAWVQRADRNDKNVIEFRRDDQEPDFPGYLNFIENLSAIEGLPVSWSRALRISKGVYLLTCPRTKEQYVGSATGDGGFLQRWEEYAATGHGGNVALKSRDPSDYQISILEVAGSAATHQDVLDMERRWKDKLRTREMGFTRN